MKRVLVSVLLLLAACGGGATAKDRAACAVLRDRGSVIQTGFDAFLERLAAAARNADDDKIRRLAPDLHPSAKGAQAMNEMIEVCKSKDVDVSPTGHK